MKKEIRLERLLANLGYGNRKGAGHMIRKGIVTLDGVPITDPSSRVLLANADKILLEGQELDPLPPLSIVMNKPIGFVCSHNDPGGGRDVFELLPPRFRERKPTLAIAGRLDMDSSGLLLLTDDGKLLHRITSPKTHLPKCYKACLDRPLTGDEAALFASGTLMLRSETTPLKPAELTVINEKLVLVTLREGRYHQVRRMFAATGNHVVSLQRLSIGDLHLGDLREGEWRVLPDPWRSAGIMSAETL